MLIENGEKIHLVYRAMYENSTRRHFIGEVMAADGPVCRLQGYVFIYDQKSTMYVKKPERRTTVVDLSESGYIVNVIDRNVSLDQIEYRYQQGVGLTATDGREFALNINEFGAKS